MSTKIYVAAAISEAPPEFQRQIAALKHVLRQHGFRILDWAPVDPFTPPPAVCCHDLKAVGQCDGLIAVMTYPSSGAGVELREALGAGKPVFIIYQAETRISKLILGLFAVFPDCHYGRYRQSPLELLNEITEWTNRRIVQPRSAEPMLFAEDVFSLPKPIGDA